MNTNNTISNESDLIKERRKKLDLLREQGNAYPNHLEEVITRKIFMKVMVIMINLL